MSKESQGYKLSLFEPTIIYLVRLQYFIWKSFYVIINIRIAIPLALSMFKELLSQHLCVVSPGRVFRVSSIFSMGCKSLESMLNIKVNF